MRLVKLDDVLIRLANLHGTQNVPTGGNADWRRDIQDAFDYAWRYYPWAFSMKTVTVDLVADPYLPADFDYLGNYQALPYTLGQDWTPLTPDQYANQPSGTRAYMLEYDAALNKYKVNVLLSGVPSMTFNYQVEPPLMANATDGVPFPSADALAVGASVMSKQGSNPSRADITQEWDQWHAKLDKLTGQAERSKPRSRARNRYDLLGTYTGDTR